MTLLGQSQPEAQRPTGPIVALQATDNHRLLEREDHGGDNTIAACLDYQNQTPCNQLATKKATRQRRAVRNCVAHRHLSLTLRGSNRIGSLSKNVFERRTSTRSRRASIPVDERSSKTLLIKFLISGRTLLAVLP